MPLVVASSGVGSMPSSASRLASGTTSVARKPSSNCLNLCPIPSAPGSCSRKAATSPSKAPMSNSGTRRSAVPAGSARPCGGGRLAHLTPAPPAAPLGRLGPGGPGRLPQIDEGLLVIQPFQFLKRPLGLLDQDSELKGDLELLGQPAAPLGLGGRPEQGRDQPGIGLQGAD